MQNFEVSLTKVSKHNEINLTKKKSTENNFFMYRVVIRRKYVFTWQTPFL